VVDKDEAEGFKWCKKAADQGYDEAQYIIGYCYAKGVVVKKDVVESKSWFEKAGDQGHAKSQLTMAIIYMNGVGVPKNRALAFPWYEKAANSGMMSAQEIMGAYYLGEQKDLGKSLYWFKKAYKQGSVLAAEPLTGIFKEIGDTKKALKYAR